MTLKTAGWKLTAIVLVAMAAFLGEMTLPQVVGLWLMYLPLSLACLWLCGSRAGLIAAAVSSVLIVAGLAIPRAGITMNLMLMGRGMGLMTLWAAVLGTRAHYMLRAAELHEIEERKASEQVLRKLNDDLELRVVERTRELGESEGRLRAIFEACADGILTSDEAGVIRSMNPAALRMFGYAEAEIIGQNLDVLTSPHHCEPHDRSLANCLTGTSGDQSVTGSEAVAVTKQGVPLQVHVSTAEFNARGEHKYAGFVRDISERKMLERELLLVTEREQTRIGMDLHDDLGQQITAMSIMNDVLLTQLKSRGAAETKMALRMAELLNHARSQVRRISRGLHPVEPDPKGLMASIEQHLQGTEAAYRIPCRLYCPESVLVHDNDAATHLFRIVQEAVHNAVRHGLAKSIWVRLLRNDGHLVLEIENTGPVIEKGRDSTRSGLGLRTMRYRAEAMKGAFDIRHPATGGTLVRCAIPEPQRNTNSQLRRTALTPIVPSLTV